MLMQFQSPFLLRYNAYHQPVDCNFIGYAITFNAYRFVVHDSKNLDTHKATIMESRTAYFVETNIFD